MTLFAKAQDSSLLESALRKIEVGATISYNDLSTLLGKRVPDECRSNLASARRILGKENIWFDVEPGVGLKRLDSRGISNAVEGRIQRSRRHARKSLKMTQSIVLEDLDDNSRRKAIAQISQLQAIELFASTKSQGKIAGKTSSCEPLSIGNTLKLFE